MTDKERLEAIRALVFEHGDANEGTDCPFWYIAIKGGILRRPVMISAGIWFSRRSAAEHLRAKAHRYPASAFVYCDSAHDSNSGLRALMRLLRDAPKEEETT